MSRASIVLNVLLILVVAALAWTLYARTGGGNAAPERMSAGESSGGMAVPSSGIDADAADRLAAQLGRIDARLATLEIAASPRGAIARVTQPAPPEMPAAEADRRLGALLPGRQIGHRELNQFHARLAVLPPEEQFALSAALSRAINENRIRMRL